MVKKIIFTLVILLAVVFIFFFIGLPPEAKEIQWGVNFSQKQAADLALDWRENYSAIINDLGVKNIRLAAYWDLIEPEENKYNFNDLDWQIKSAEEKGVKILLVIGMKVPRWPECHLPEWAIGLNKEAQQVKIIKLLREIVLRYRDRVSVAAWQVENEPLFPFGDCPWTDKNFLKKEAEMVKYLDDKKRPIIISDSGEGSFWFEAAKLGDIIGTTMYKKVWFKELKSYVSYPFPPVFYWRKAQIIKRIFNKEVIVVELQAEPWLSRPEKTMNLEQFKNNINFARATGLKEFYLWGSEWWYWLKEKNNDSSLWDEAKKLFHG